MTTVTARLNNPLGVWIQLNDSQLDALALDGWSVNAARGCGWAPGPVAFQRAFPDVDPLNAAASRFHALVGPASQWHACHCCGANVTFSDWD